VPINQICVSHGRRPYPPPVKVQIGGYLSPDRAVFRMLRDLRPGPMGTPSGLRSAGTAAGRARAPVPLGQVVRVRGADIHG
jgi:hypothetical protein